ncbi:hypothetical protein I3842_07G071200 [Carya illinoinensis]|uniref:Uncharacterized protein n=1 Tax=Carya illinoinensis TaxID=32201 RepID=A0A922JD18_CARIL|nr:hypothetical protein I3842_07G071200 [Carya illinoinensis]
MRPKPTKGTTVRLRGSQVLWLPFDGPTQYRGLLYFERKKGSVGRPTRLAAADGGPNGMVRGQPFEGLVEGTTITFGDKDEEGILHPHDDALVVTMQIMNFTTRRVLIDNGSLANILFWKAFVRLGINLNRLRLAPMPLKGFIRDIVQPMGAITISLLARKAPRTSATMADFLVVKAFSSYNAILGCSTLNSLRVVTSTYHLKMKFPKNLGVGEVAWECYSLRHEVKEVKMVGEAGDVAGPPSMPTLAKRDEGVRDEQALL